MSESLLVAGIVCIVGAIVGGGVKLLGAEVPVLNSFGRQALLFLVGVAFLIGSFRLPGPKPTAPGPIPPAITTSGPPAPNASSSGPEAGPRAAACPEARALDCLPPSSRPVSFADPAAANAGAAANLRKGLSTSVAEARAVAAGATGKAARLCGIVASDDSSPLGLHNAAERLNSLGPADGQATSACLKAATGFL